MNVRTEKIPFITRILWEALGTMWSAYWTFKLNRITVKI